MPAESKGLLVAIVRTGTVYPFTYVERMRNMVARHLALPYEMICFTDQPERCEGITFIDCAESGLQGWWAKMLLFEPSWRGHKRVIYVDIDSVVIGDLSPLARVPGEFCILESPVRLAGNRSYPCRYNSSCMVIGAGQAGFIWDTFTKRESVLLHQHERYGDQALLEDLYPDARLLQRLLPDFFINYRHLTMIKPLVGSVVNFGGAHKPHNCPIPWVQEAWS